MFFIKILNIKILKRYFNQKYSLKKKIKHFSLIILKINKF
jgi:hypothetical protein